MEWLNYHHLFYFWTVARMGGITAASKELRLSTPTVSAQLRALEEALGEKLFARAGRNLVLTDMGRTVYGYADEIFSLGRELLDTVKDRPTGSPLRVTIGIADVVPKLVAYHLIEPVFELGGPVRIVCREASAERLLGELATHELDVVLSDTPVGSALNVRAFNHLLGESQLIFMATRTMADAYRRGFPRSLNGAPILLPAENTGLRRSLDQWFEEHEVRPRIVGEFQDYALLRIFGEAGRGVFPVPSLLQPEMQKRYDLRQVGRTAAVYGRFYAISPERKLKHPAVVAICDTARARLFS